MADPAVPIPLLPDYGTGVYRRRILIETRPGPAGRVLAELQDDFHHFAVDLHHDGSAVTGARGGALRVPWTTCGGSIPPLERLRGMALTVSLRVASRHTDRRLQCTHLFDLAVLAVAHAARGADGARRYEVSVPDRVQARTRATLDRDGARLLEWELDGDAITGPDADAGRSLAAPGFGAWVESLGADLGEAVQVLRRAAFISMGRRYDFERMTHAGQFGPLVAGACHTFSPEWIQAAKRSPGTWRDFGADTSEIFGPGFSAAFLDFERAGAS